MGTVPYSLSLHDCHLRHQEIVTLKPVTEKRMENLVNYS